MICAELEIGGAFAQCAGDKDKIHLKLIEFVTKLGGTEELSNQTLSNTEKYFEEWAQTLWRTNEYKAYILHSLFCRVGEALGVGYRNGTNQMYGMMPSTRNASKVGEKEEMCGLTLWKIRFTVENMDAFTTGVRPGFVNFG